MSKSDIDWMRATHNLEPRPLDWQDKLVFSASLAACIVFILILLEGAIK